MSKKNYVPLLRYSGFCIFYHFTNFETCDAMMSISTMRQMEQGVLYGNSGCGFLKILHNESGQGFKNYSSCFHEKIFVRDKWIILGQNWCVVVTLNPLSGFYFFFAQWKGRRNASKLCQRFFPKKSLFGANGPFWIPNKYLLCLPECLLNHLLCDHKNLQPRIILGTFWIIWTINNCDEFI